MERASDRKIILVTRKTRLQELIARFNSASQAKFYLEHLGADFHDYEAEDAEYRAAVAAVASLVERHGRMHAIDRAYLPNFIFGKEDLVIALGQDGMVANTLKYLDGNGLLGVNPSPQRWDGVLLPFRVKDLEKILPEAVRDTRPRKEVTMAEAVLNDGQTLLAVNDIFIGQKTHVSARYQVEFAGQAESQSSSGIIVSTGLGSTGWFKSVLAGSLGIMNSLSAKPLQIKDASTFAWDSRYLYFSVREPFPSKATKTNLIFGKVSPEKPLIVHSFMAENGVLFSDGIEADFLEFNSGKTANINLARKKGILIH